MRTNEVKLLNCIELFAGAGGLMLGLEMAGFRTLLANEIHPDPCKTLSKNFPSTSILMDDIRKYSGKDLVNNARENLGSNAHIDLIAGGPPCQGFSNAGMKDPDDPRNTLIGEFLRVVKEIRPDFFLLENVVGLIQLHGGRLFDRVLEEIEATGYNFRYQILFAADYGVPQMRKRLIVLGARGANAPDFPLPKFRSSNSNMLSFVGDLPPYVTCGDAIGDLPLIGPGQKAFYYDKDPQTAFQRSMREGANVLYNHETARHAKQTMDYYALVPMGGTWLDIPKELRKKKQGMQRWPVNGLSRTITTEPTDFLHPTLNRVPTVREMARIQTFPDTYEFLGQRTTGNKMRRLGYCSQTQQVGNAVPPFLARAVGEKIAELIN